MDLRYPLIEAERATVAAATVRWLERAVIGLELCPFARAVHLRQQIRYAITGAVTSDEVLEELEQELRALVAADPAYCDTTLLILPHALRPFLDFHFFQAEAQALLVRLELTGVLQLASFHPRYEFSGIDADDPANNSNRAPHPILHLLREASVARATRGLPDAARLYERNIQLLRTLGHAGWRRLWD